MPIADLDELWALIEGRFDDLDAAIAALGNPWEYPVRTLTMSSAQVQALIDAQDIAIVRGDTVTMSFEGLGSLVGNQKAWFTMKNSALASDDDAIIMIEKTAGLLKLNQDDAPDPLLGSLVIDDESLGNISITIEASASMQLASKNYVYDIQWMDASDKIFTIQLARAIVVSDVTRTIT